MPGKKAPKKLTDQQEKCLSCRECCEFTEVPCTMLSVEVIEYFNMRGQKFYLGKGGEIMIRFQSPCVHLKKEGCDIYEDRPDTCREYMCEFGDKTIKIKKDEQCAAYMSTVMESIKNHRKENGK